MKSSFAAFAIGAVCLWSGTPVSPAAAASEANFTCIAAPRVQLPPRDADDLDATPSLEPTPVAPCPAGQVPQPADRFAAKGMPRVRDKSGVLSGVVPRASNNAQYYYNSLYNFTNAYGASGEFTQDRPALASSASFDTHSLAELAVEDSTEQQIVEIGRNIDVGVNGDDQPHLFTYHWVNGNETCYNGCGFVQVSTTLHPGMAVAVTSVPQKYAIVRYQNNWWIKYQKQYVGYFPGTIWPGKFTYFALAQWFGEVYDSVDGPCTQMGNGLLGTQAGAAIITRMRFGNGAIVYATGTTVTTPGYYNLGSVGGGAFTLQHAHFQYGGPGAC
jgi:hypothetical protein